MKKQQRNERRKTIAAFFASVLVHLILLLLAILILSLGGGALKQSEAPDDEPMELTILSPPVIPEPSERRFVDSSQSEETDREPQEAVFESDRNTRASSERSAEGEGPLPTTDGEDLPGLALRNQEVALGPAPDPGAIAPPPAPQQAEPQEPKETEDEKKPSEEERKEPTKEEPKPTPKEQETKLALLEPAPKPPPPKPETQARPQTPAPPRPSRPPGYQPQTRTTRLTGGLSNKGRPSIEARATPLGRYQKMVSDAVGSRWYYYVNQRMGLVTTGSVRVRFIVRTDGKVEGVQLRDNTSNESLASVSVQSIVEAEVPPIPEEIAATLDGGRLEIDYTFTIY